ncbi:MAG: threonylcarbamoyl-AMP synthase [Bacteroidetes bacterium]|nr:threonylcarbamoyl-AMP synthase [Bacteroidota bacterium]
MILQVGTVFFQNIYIYGRKFEIELILEATDANIELAAQEILSGEVAAFPTETVYGLGADGFNPIAVSKIFEVKSRPSFNPLILHISSFDQLEDICEVNNPLVEELIHKFWPGPLTLVLPKKNIVPEIVTSGNPTVAVRMPRHEVATKLLKLVNRPVAAPSANAFGFLSPTHASHVEKQLGSKIKIILDGGGSAVGIESTILEASENEFIMLRPGGLSVEEIESITGKLGAKENNFDKPNSPGQINHHYAPNIPIKFIDEHSLKFCAPEKTAALFFSSNNTGINFSTEKVLSPTSDMHEAAANLFKYLHELETSNAELILVEKVNASGLGIAIMDRLTKAVNRYS